MTIVAHAYTFVIGVDTHAGTHTYAIRRAGTGELADTDTFPTTASGIGRAIAWAGRRTGGDVSTLWVIEGVGSYGAILAGRVRQAGYEVVEAPAMPSAARRGIGKSDPLDAAAIAAAVLPIPTSLLRHPRGDDGIRAALQVLTTARDGMTTERTRHVNALTALVRNTDLGIDARNALTPGQITEISRWRNRHEDIATATARDEATRLASRTIQLDTDLTGNETRITELLRASNAAPLLNEPGIGPISAAIVLCAWSHPGRIRNADAFASLAGVNPIPASSGKTERHRLNRGGDRRLNRALHTIAKNRLIYDAESRKFLEARTTDPDPRTRKTYRDVRRSLKHYIARHLYRQLNTLYADPTPA